MANNVVLDTDVASLLQRGAAEAEHLEVLAGSVAYITFVTVGEFYKGAHKRGWSAERIAEYERWLRRLLVLPYDSGVAPGVGSDLSRG